MTYDTQLQQWLDHEHEADTEIQSHINNRGNPHLVTPEQLGNSNPKWNANSLMGIPVVLQSLKDGWGLAFNEVAKRFELFPFNDPEVINHDKLANYKQNEHVPLNDSRITKQNIWSALKVMTEQARLENEILQKQKQQYTILLDEVNRLKEQLSNEYNLAEGGDFSDDSGMIMEGGDFDTINLDNNLNFGTF